MDDENHPPSDGPEATIVIQTRVRPGTEEAFAAWQQRMSELVARAPGFRAHGFTPPDPPVQLDWVIMERFSSRATARAWLDSPERQAQLTQIADLIDGDQSISIIDEAPATRSRATTAVILTTVEADKADRFRAWHKEAVRAADRWPGHLGTTLQAPVPGVQDQWVTMVTFDSDEHLAAWMGSDDRRALLERGGEIFRDTATRRAQAGFDQWFEFKRAGGAAQPPPWKFNYLILVGLYPIVMLEILFLNNKLDWMQLSLGNLIGNVLSVALLGWPVVAILGKLMGWWIQPAPGASRWTDLKGALVMLLALAVLVAVFYVVVKNVGFDAKVPDNPGTWIAIPIAVGAVFLAWFSPLGEKLGVWRWPK
jgi:uncharacterized protein